MSKDTNAQESLGGDFQRTAQKAKLTIAETLEHSYRYLHAIEYDYSLASLGMPLRYASRKRKSKTYQNDGRAPDSTEHLVAITGRSSGRPKGSKNKIPRLGNDVDWSTTGIPWGCAYHDFTVTNTCSLDTALMAFYLNHKYNDATILNSCNDDFIRQTLRNVVSALDADEYDKARYIWCTEAIKLPTKGNHDIFGSIDQVFLQLIPGMSQLTVTLASHCDAIQCPQKYCARETNLPEI
jgi:hypothetical protein